VKGSLRMLWRPDNYVPWLSPQVAIDVGEAVVETECRAPGIRASMPYLAGVGDGRSVLDGIVGAQEAALVAESSGGTRGYGCQSSEVHGELHGGGGVEGS